MGVNQIHILRKKSNAFVSNLNDHIIDVIEHNERLIKLNKAQLKASKTAKGGELVNIMTGSPFYSPSYAKKKGYKKPDLYDTGEFYREMDILVNEPNEYFLTSFSEKTRHLLKMYTDNIFGIQDKKKAQRIAVPELKKTYIAKVL